MGVQSDAMSNNGSDNPSNPMKNKQNDTENDKLRNVGFENDSLSISARVCEFDNSILIIAEGSLYLLNEAETRQIALPLSDYSAFGILVISNHPVIVLCKSELSDNEFDIESTHVVFWDFVEEVIIWENKISGFIYRDMYFCDNRLYYLIYENDAGFANLYYEEIGVEKKLIAKGVTDFSVQYDKVYFTKSEGHSFSEYNVFSCDLTGGNAEIILKEAIASAVGFIDNIVLLFTDSGTVFIDLITGENNSVRVRLAIRSVIEYNERLYFNSFDTDEDRGIYSINKDGSDLIRISSIICGGMAYSSDYLYLYPYDGYIENIPENIDMQNDIITDGVYRMGLDGLIAERVIEIPDRYVETGRIWMEGS